MRLKGMLPITLTALVAVACTESTGVAVQDLIGTWNATEYGYVNNADTTQQVDLIVQGVSFEMTVTEDGTASTLFTDAQGGTSSDSGTLDVTGTLLTIAGNAFAATRSGNQMTLEDQTNAYDFDGDGSDESATVMIRMLRQ